VTPPALTFARERNLIERFFSRLKHFRRVATRHDKLAANFLGMVQLASMRLWLRSYESTTWIVATARAEVSAMNDGVWRGADRNLRKIEPF
jgi:hypothetical protein